MHMHCLLKVVISSPLLHLSYTACALMSCVSVKRRPCVVYVLSSNHGANPTFFDKKNKDWKSRTLVTPTPYVR